VSDDQLAAIFAKHRKVPLDMDNAERLRLMDVLLRITDIAGKAFDVLDSKQVSEADILVIVQLPDYCNAFTTGLTAHAMKKAR
jgi:hypothetical protein